MEDESEIARAKWLLGAVTVFLVSAIISYREFVYVARGRDTEATVMKAYEMRRDQLFGLIPIKKLVVDYEYTDAENHRHTGSDEVGGDWSLPPTGTVPVRYTQGSSRLAGHHNWLGLGLFGASLAWLGWSGFWFWRHVSEAVSDKKPRRMK